MNVLPSLETYDLTHVPKHVLAEDIGLLLDIDINDSNILIACTDDNLIEKRVKFNLIKTVGKGNNIWSTGTLCFDDVDVFTFTTQGGPGKRELHKFILNEKLYMDMLQYMGSFHNSDSEVLFTLENDNMNSWYSIQTECHS